MTKPTIAPPTMGPHPPQSSATGAVGRHSGSMAAPAAPLQFTPTDAAAALPIIDIEAVLDALMAAADRFGVEPTIALRADLRKVMINKPPPQIACERTKEIFGTHMERQAAATMVSPAQVVRH